MARRGAWTCAVTLTLFALGGSLIFTLFGITLGAFKIAGGVLIGLNAIDMVQARRSQQQETPVERAEGAMKEDIGIIPLGLPMLAGPGAISTVMVLAGQSSTPVTTFAVYGAIALTAFVSFLTLATATMVERRLGQYGNAHPHPLHGTGAVRDCRAVHRGRDQDVGARRHAVIRIAALALIGAWAPLTLLAAQHAPTAHFSGQGVLIYTGVDPIPGAAPSREARLVQPIVMLDVAALRSPPAVSCLSVDFEGWTLPDGELCARRAGERATSIGAIRTRTSTS